jgi:Chitin synthase
MDDFSWGNTRVVVGEGANKKVMIDDDEKFDDSMIPMKRFSGALFLGNGPRDPCLPGVQNMRRKHGKRVRVYRRTVELAYLVLPSPNLAPCRD